MLTVHFCVGQVLNLIEAAAEGVKSEASSEGPVELTEGPPPLVKCAALLPLGPSRRPVVLQRTSGKQAESVFQYRAEMTSANKDEEPPPPEVSHTLSMSITPLAALNMLAPNHVMQRTSLSVD